MVEALKSTDGNQIVVKQNSPRFPPSTFSMDTIADIRTNYLKTGTPAAWDGDLEMFLPPDGLQDDLVEERERG